MELISTPAGGPALDEGSDGPPRLTAASPAGAVLLAYLRRQAARVQAEEASVRLDASDSVHRMRVATRRLRSALITFDVLVDGGGTGPLLKRLRWLARILGAARDAEVMRDRLRDAVEGEGRLLAVAADLDDALPELGEAYRTAHAGVVTALDSDRYQELVTMLQVLVTEPPLRKRAGTPAGAVLPALVARSYDSTRRAVEEARSRPAGAERDDVLHDARKAAKQARYAGEAVAQVFPGDATRFAAAMEDVQEALGEHQDSVLTRGRLRDLALAASSTEVAFLCGRLHAQEEARTEPWQQRFDVVWEIAARTSADAWLQQSRVDRKSRALR